MLQGRHGALGRRNCGKQPLSGIVVRCGEGGILQPVRGPWALGEPGRLAVDFTVLLSFVLGFSHLNGTGWREAAGVGCFHPPDQLNSGGIVSP